MKVQFVLRGKCVRTVVLSEKALTVGRQGGKAEIQLPGDDEISRKHGKLWFERGAVWYQDLGSMNGTWLGNRKIEEAIKLESGRILRLGRTQLLLSSTRLPEAKEQDSDLTVIHGGHDGLSLQMRGETGEDAFRKALQGESSSYLKILSELVSVLLRSTTSKTMSHVLRSVDSALEGDQEISIVTWPRPDDGMDYIVPPISGKWSPVSYTLCKKAATCKEGLLFSEAAAELGDTDASVALKKIRSAIYCPILGEADEVVGIFCVNRTMPGFPFDRATFQFIAAVSGLISASLSAESLREKARLKEIETREAEARRQGLAKFLSIASHDLKNPLTVILGSSKLVQQLDDIEKIQQLNQKIVKAGERAQALIEAYLEASKVSGNADLNLSLEPIKMRDLVEEELNFMKDSEKLDHIDFQNKVGELTLKGDRQKLQQVLFNLISNAAKYSPEGGEVRLSSEVTRDEVTIAISDKGVGISEEDQKKLFQQFQRVGNRALAEGTGLGLWLANALVCAHGGSIKVDSQPGDGSTFEVKLPRELLLSQ